MPAATRRSGYALLPAVGLLGPRFAWQLLSLTHSVLAVVLMCVSASTDAIHNSDVSTPRGRIKWCFYFGAVPKHPFMPKTFVGRWPSSVSVHIVETSAGRCLLVHAENIRRAIRVLVSVDAEMPTRRCLLVPSKIPHF